jgi:hypothetical protein
MKTVTLPHITQTQHKILDLLYEHRFLTRTHIQTMLHHKDKKTINLWLKDLREKDYISWMYNKDHFAEKTKPAVYYLGSNGIRHFLRGWFRPTEDVRTRYREHERSQSFIERCLTIADVCLSLESARNEASFPQSWYLYETEAEYQTGSYYHFLSESELIKPHLCFCKELYDGSDDPHAVESYLLEIFAATLPRYRLRSTLQHYVTYLEEEADEWEEGSCGDPLPYILLVCATLTDLIYAKRRTRGLLAEIWEPSDEYRPHIRFTTIDKLKMRGVLDRQIWEEA